MSYKAWNKCLTKTNDKRLIKLGKNTSNAYKQKAIEKALLLGPLTSIEKQILYGSILGDGHLRMNKGALHARYSEGHCAAQKEYASWKVVNLKRLGFVLRQYKQNGGAPIFIRSPSMIQLTELYNQFYPHGQKRLPKEILHELTPLALAVWFMDDGTLHPKGGAYLYVYKLFIDEAEFVKQLFEEKFNIKCKIYILKSGRMAGKPEIYFPKEEFEKFKKLIRPHIHPTMLYKLGET